MKIVKIIDSSAVVINAGKNDGIELGDKFQIMGSAGETVKDPETGQVLGTLDAIKGIVKATHIYSEMTVLETIRTKTSMIASPLVVGLPNRLKVDNSEITGGMPNDDEPVKIGDEVVKL